LNIQQQLMKIFPSSASTIFHLIRQRKQKGEKGAAFTYREELKRKTAIYFVKPTNLLLASTTDKWQKGLSVSPLYFLASLFVVDVV